MTRLRRYAASARPARRLASLAEGRAPLVLLTTGIVTLVGGADLHACPMCFGAEESPLVEASKLGIFVLLGITLAVQGAFAGFFLYLRKRAKQHADLELETEWSELQKPSGTR